MGEGWWGGSRKSYSEHAEIASFSRWDSSWSNNKHDTFWHFVSTRYFYVLFLWTIAISDFRPLEICKNLGLPLSTITYIQYEISFFTKIQVKVFYIQIWFKWEPWSTGKTLYRKKYEKVIELHFTHMTSHAIWVDEIAGVMISIKKINKH